MIASKKRMGFLLHYCSHLACPNNSTRELELYTTDGIIPSVVYNKICLYFSPWGRFYSERIWSIYCESTIVMHGGTTITYRASPALMTNAVCMGRSQKTKLRDTPDCNQWPNYRTTKLMYVFG